MWNDTSPIWWVCPEGKYACGKLLWQGVNCAADLCCADACHICLLSPPAWGCIWKMSALQTFLHEAAVLRNCTLQPERGRAVHSYCCTPAGNIHILHNKRFPQLCHLFPTDLMPWKRRLLQSIWINMLSWGRKVNINQKSEILNHHTFFVITWELPLDF